MRAAESALELNHLECTRPRRASRFALNFNMLLVANLRPWAAALFRSRARPIDVSRGTHSGPLNGTRTGRNKNASIIWSEAVNGTNLCAYHLASLAKVGRGWANLRARLVSGQDTPVCRVHLPEPQSHTHTESLTRVAQSTNLCKERWRGRSWHKTRPLLERGVGGQRQEMASKINNI